jgi:4-amino-4-deoxy-L-arabinose transferase-like glycosyltransferase
VPLLPRSRPLRRLLWTLLALALVARLALAWELTSRRMGREATPPQDMWLYDQESQLILAGDWTLSGAFGLLEAHHELGIGHSTYLVTLGKPWVEQTYGPRPLVNAPLYPALLTIPRALSGSAQLARILQVLATLLLAVGTYVLVRLLRGDARMAGLAGALVAFHPTTVFYAGFLLRTTLISLLLLALTLGAALYARAPSGRRAAALGGLTALNHMAKGVLPFLIPLSLVALWLGRSPRRPAHAGAWLAGFLLAASPLLARNLACQSPLLHVGIQARVGLIDSNFEGADGLHLVRPPPAYVDAVLAGAGRSDVGALLAAIRTHPEPTGFPRLLLAKLRGFTSSYEPRNNLDYHATAPVVSSLRAFPLGTWPLLALALVGLPALVRDWRRWWPVLLGLLVPLGVVMASAAHARYRLPAVPFLAVGAALAASALWRQPRSARRLGLAALGLIVALGVTLPWEHRADVSVPEHLAWTIQGRRYEREGEVTLAKQSALRATRALPRVRDATAAHPPPASADAQRLLELHAWAHALCIRDGDEAGARWLRESLARFDAAAAERLGAGR